MRDFLLSSCAPMIWVISGLELLLIVFLAIRCFKTNSMFSLVVLAITCGLFIDAFLIALGSLTDASDFAGLSRLRFIAHGLLIPLLFVICSLGLDLKKPFNYIMYALTFVLMGLGLAEAIATKLDVVYIAGVSRMASVKGLTPAWAEGISKILSFGTVLPLMGVGIYCWIKQKNSFLFLSGFFMFAFSALGPATGNADLIFYVSMYGELLMIIFLVLYVVKKENKCL